MSSVQLHIGQRVRYTSSSGDIGYGKLVRKACKDGMTIYDVKLDEDEGSDRVRWGYEDQFESQEPVTPLDLLGAPLLAELNNAGFKVIKR